MRPARAKRQIRVQFGMGLGHAFKVEAIAAVLLAPKCIGADADIDRRIGNFVFARRILGRELGDDAPLPVAVSYTHLI